MQSPDSVPSPPRRMPRRGKDTHIDDGVRGAVMCAQTGDDKRARKRKPGDVLVTPTSSPIKPISVWMAYDDDFLMLESPFRSAVVPSVQSGGSLYNTPVPVRSAWGSQSPFPGEMLPFSPTPVLKASRRLFMLDEDVPVAQATPEPLLVSKQPPPPPPPLQQQQRKKKDTPTTHLADAVPAAIAAPTSSGRKKQLVAAAQRLPVPPPPIPRVVPPPSADVGPEAPKDKRAKPEIVSPVTSAASSESERPCHCKKTSCLKLYCDCFAANLFCGALCKCLACMNNADPRNVRRREDAIASKMLRLSHASGVKDAAASPEVQPGTRGCKCVRSECMSASPLSLCRCKATNGHDQKSTASATLPGCSAPRRASARRARTTAPVL